MYEVNSRWVGWRVRCVLAAPAVLAALTLAACRPTALPKPTDFVVTGPPALIDPGAPPSDVLTTFLTAVASGDTTTAWAMVSPLQRQRCGGPAHFRAKVCPGLAREFAEWRRPTGQYEIRLERRIGRFALVAGVTDVPAGGKVSRRVPFAFVLSRTATSPVGDDRWRVGAGDSPAIERADRPQGVASMYGTAEIRFVVRPGKGRRIEEIRAWLDDRPLRVRLVTVQKPTLVAMARLADLPAGAHRVVAFASDTKRRADAQAWQFIVPRLPSRLPSLQPGTTSQAVRELQQRLADLGYDVIPDGYYGGDTEHAVTAFQKLAGLNPDGVAGMGVRRRLARPLAVRPRTSHEGSWVEIDLSRQVLLYVTAGHVERIVDISSGRPGWRTATGSFTFERSISGWRQSALGLLWNPFYFNGGQAVHGAPYVPPYPASHGCVRVPMSSMDRLIPLLAIGMPCEVYGDAP